MFVKRDRYRQIPLPESSFDNIMLTVHFRSYFKSHIGLISTNFMPFAKRIECNLNDQVINAGYCLLATRTRREPVLTNQQLLSKQHQNPFLQCIQGV